MKSLGFVIVAALSTLARSACAHVLPVHHVIAELRGTGEGLHLYLDTNAIYWHEEVLGAEPPLENWPKEDLDKAKAYIDGHLELALDGKPLKGRLLEARYSQEPWQDWKSGRVHYRLVYPLPKKSGTLTGKMSFFFEEKAHEKGAHGREVLRVAKEKGFPREYWTDLSVRGRVSKKLKLIPGKPDFRFPLADVMQSLPQAAAESGVLGFRWSFHQGALLLFAACLALFRGGKRSWWAALPAALAVPAFMLFPLLGLHGRTAAALAWSLAALAALGARSRMPFKLWVAAAAAAVPAWVMVLRGAMDSMPYRLATPAGDGAFLAGAFLAAALAAGAVQGLMTVYRLRLREHTESRAEEIFESRMDSAAVLALIIAALFVVKTLASGGAHV